MSHTSLHTKYSGHSMPPEQQHPGLTNGPARFVVTNDGSKECLALLVTELFLDKLNSMFEQDRDLNIIKGPVSSAKREINGIESSIKSAKQSLESAKGETEQEEIRQYLDHQESRLRNMCNRKDELEGHCAVLEREIDLSANYTHWVLENAMESANLLRRGKAVSLPAIDSGEPIQFPERQPEASQSRPRPVPSPQELQRQAAYEELKDCWYHFQKVQRLFNEREYVYNDELAEYKQRCLDGTCSFPRSELDRRQLQYGMELTGALIDAESCFERAKERADALGVGSTSSDSSYDHQYEENTSKEQVQVSASMLDRSFIETWRADVSGHATQTQFEMMTAEDFDAGLVDISDSMSARDCGEYRKKIDRWQKACGVHEGCNRQQANGVWTNEGAAAERRASA